MQDGQYLGGMGAAIESYALKPGDEGYVAKEGEEGYVPPTEELKFGDEGYVLKEGDEGYVAPEPELEVIDYATFEKEDLVTKATEFENKIKEFEQVVSEREKTISELEEAKGAGAGANDEELALIRSLSEDFVGNYDKAKEKFGLPSIETLKELVSEGNIDDKVKHWQDTELTKAIEQKHGLEEGEYEYDSNEASKAGTASYDWDTMSADKRAELVGSLRERQSAEAGRLRAVEKQQAEDITWLAETYYENKPELVDEKVTAMNNIVTSIAQGQETAEKHPFAIRNLVRGVFFDELTTSMVDKAVNELVQQFAEHNMYLPSKELPTNVTEIKGAPTPTPELEVDKEKMKISPMLSSIYNTANKK
jgi:hypothetical protein